MISGPFLLGFPKLRIFHAVALLMIFAMEIFSIPCPLTHLEEWLIHHQDPTFSYGGSLIQHYLLRLVYPNLPPSLILWATLLLLITTVAALAWKSPFRKGPLSL